MTTVTPTSKYRNVLDKTTLVPIGLVVGVCMALFAGWQYLDSRFDSLEDTLRDQGREMQSMKRELTDDRWRRTDQRLWAAKLKGQNPALKVPQIEEN